MNEAVSTPALSVIGLDSATFAVIDPLVARGDLPNLARLLEGGASGTLWSTTHPLTPHAWTTLITGVTAGRHGIWDFTERAEDGYQMQLVNGSHRRAAAVWDLLDVAGRRSGLVSIPYTWPAPHVNGFAIAGFDAAEREAGLAHPEEIAREMVKRFGSPELDNKFPLDGDGELDLATVKRAAEQKVELTLALTESYEPELLVVVFMAADHVHHLCWSDWEAYGPDSPVADVYRALDDAVGALLSGVGPDANVMVVSDHGAGPLSGVVNLNAWLAQEGYLTYLPGSAGLSRRLADTAFDLRRGLPQGFRYRLKQRLPQLRDRLYSRREYSAIDWSRTQAFAYGLFGNIVINVRGRESQGVVEPSDYERVRDAIAERALELRGPSGEQIVAAVHRREDMFFGPELEKLPDLVVEFQDYAWLGKGNLKKRGESLWDRVEIPGSSHPYVGTHRRDGIFILSGACAKPRKDISASIVDVAPTMLYLLGEPVPTTLEGRVLTEAIDEGLLESRPPEFDDSRLAEFRPAEPRSAAGDDVERRLRALGYIE